MFLRSIPLIKNTTFIVMLDLNELYDKLDKSTKTLISTAVTVRASKKALKKAEIKQKETG